MALCAGVCVEEVLMVLVCIGDLVTVSSSPAVYASKSHWVSSLDDEEPSPLYCEL